MIEETIDLKKEASFVRRLFYENIAKKDTSFEMSKPKEVSGLLKEVTRHSSEVISNCLGLFGVQVSKFVEHFDLNHPAISNIVGEFAEFGELCDYLAVGQAAMDLDASGILAIMRNCVNEKKFAKNFCNHISTTPPIRAIKDRSVRDHFRSQARLSRRVLDIQFSEFKPDTLDWTMLPGTMSSYVRLHYPDLVDLSRLAEMRKKFNELGMIRQSEACYNAARATNIKKSESYCGFYKANIEEIGAVLAKTHGFTINSEGTTFPSHRNVELMEFLLRSIYFSPNRLRDVAKYMGCHWDSEVPTTFAGMMRELNSELDLPYMAKLVNNKRPSFCGVIRLYLANSLSKMLPYDLLDTMYDLDRFHDFGCKSLFDHFLIMVPTISLNESQNDGNIYIRDAGAIESFDKRDEASVFLDLLMIKKGIVRPFLIGQAGDRHYPITYW